MILVMWIRNLLDKNRDGRIELAEFLPVSYSLMMWFMVIMIASNKQEYTDLTLAIVAFGSLGHGVIDLLKVWKPSFGKKPSDKPDQPAMVDTTKPFEDESS